MINQKNFTVSDIGSLDITFYLSDSLGQFNPRVFPPHSHDVFEIYFLISGNVSFMVENNVYKLNNGDVIISRPNEVHNCILNEKSVHKHACLWINTSTDFLFSKLTNKNVTHLSTTNEEREKLIKLFNDLNQEKDDFSIFATTINILKLLYSANQGDSSSCCVPNVLKQILLYINEKFKTIQNVKEVLDKFYISKTSLIRLFKKHLHTTPKLYLETKKLAYSRILLKHGESVLDACFLSGFSDYSNYIRLFRKRFNITPGKYRTKDVTF
ncbi:MAG: helix-turn-helix domain-containing protein [Clostridia bacterium]|nr:helix-turn-helix domain-containing protein [Clostridia bacterium]